MACARIDRRSFLTVAAAGASLNLMDWKSLWRSRLLRAAGTAHRSQPPNIVLVLVDDMGWTGVQCFGNARVPTPHIDRLAAEGMKFTSAYVMPQCTPTRAALLTGQHTARTGITAVIPGRTTYPYAKLRVPSHVRNLPRETFTVAEALKQAGYATACIGKWHLHDRTDGDYTRLYPQSAAHYGFDYVQPRGLEKGDDKGVNGLTEEAMRFMQAHRDRPLFLYLSHYTVHTPVAAPPELVRRYRDRGFPQAGPDQAEGRHNATYLAMIDLLDQSVGRLLAKLDELGLTDDTAVFFVSDNGGVLRCTDNAPLRWGKATPYEGGIRVPMIVRWPGHVEPDTVCDTPIHVVDFYPTFLEMAGAGPKAGHILDGVSFVPLLKRSGPLARDTLYWHLPVYDPKWPAVPSAVIRKGDYKLIEFFADYIDLDRRGTYIPGHRIELYDLRTDVGERHNLAERMPDKTEELLRLLHRWQASVGARMPVPNPDFDVGRALEPVTVR